jgi:hypothetical protein
MEMDETGKARPRMPIVDWSPADGDFVHHCPTYAINAEPAESNGNENQPQSADAKTPEEREERLEAS